MISKENNPKEWAEQQVRMRKKIMGVAESIKEGSAPIKPYVCIGQPRRDLKEVAAQNLEGYFGTHIDLCGFSHYFVNIGGQKVDSARNYLIQAAINSGAEYLLFMGEDTVMPYDGFTKLHQTALKNPGCMIVGVYYIKMSSPMIMVKHGNHIIPADVTPGQLLECWQTGLDAALIPVSILKDMQKDDPEIPWCCIVNTKDDEGRDLFVGEDNFFQHRLMQCGFRTLCDTDVQCLHMDLATVK